MLFVLIKASIISFIFITISKLTSSFITDIPQVVNFIIDDHGISLIAIITSIIFIISALILLITKNYFYRFIVILFIPAVIALIYVPESNVILEFVSSIIICPAYMYINVQKNPSILEYV